MDKELQQLFDKLNKQHFQGELPYPIEMFFNYRGTRSGGRFIFTRDGKLSRIIINGKMNYYGEEEIENILLHEMVHFWEFLQSIRLIGIGYTHEKSMLFIWKLDQVGGRKKCSRIPSKEEIMDDELGKLADLFSS